MAKKPLSGKDEKLQIAVLTFFMTAAGFLLLTLYLQWFSIPSQEARAENAKKAYADLTKELQDQEMRQLRHQAKLEEETSSDQNVREIINEKLQVYGLAWADFPAAKAKGSRQEKGLTEITQTLVLEAAPMQKVLQFIASVREVKKSVEISSVDLNRDKRGRKADPEADSWKTTVVFIDYEKSR